MEEEIRKLLEERAYHCVDCLDTDEGMDTDEWAAAIAREITSLMHQRSWQIYLKAQQELQEKQ